MDKKENNLSPDLLIPGYLRGELNPEEIKVLLNWIKSNPSNKRQFDEYCEIWVTARSDVRHPEYNFHKGFWKFKQRIRETEKPAREVNRKRLYINLMKYAAALIIAASVSGLLCYYFGREQLKNQYRAVNELIVPLGSSARFSLPDGTSVTLNAGSKLTFDNCIGIDDRVVTLEGEAFFNVAKGSDDKPFTVRTSHINVMALGTIFNVKAYSNDKTIETTLVEGSIKIEGVDAQGTTEVTVLKPNQKFTFYKEESTNPDKAATEDKEPVPDARPAQVQKTVAIPRVITENVNVEPIISWKESRWIFEKQSLEQIAIELERRFDVEILFESERLKSLRFTGIILDEPIEQVLEVMSISFPINFDLKGKVVTLSENKNFEELSKRLYNQK